jgi:retron-type reverse transcriptase
MVSGHQSYEEFKEIPKPGGVRLLGIPTVLDRVIQQAVARIFNRIWDNTFNQRPPAELGV